MCGKGVCVCIKMQIVKYENCWWHLFSGLEPLYYKMNTWHYFSFQICGVSISCGPQLLNVVHIIYSTSLGGQTNFSSTAVSPSLTSSSENPSWPLTIVSETIPYRNVKLKTDVLLHFINVSKQRHIWYNHWYLIC